jgi:hypothetical protein
MRRYRIGRAETNDIVLLEPSVSREHAELIGLGHGLFTLRDLGSSYGTSMRQGSDWSLITAAQVQADTPIRIGEFETTAADLVRDAAVAAERPEAPAAPAWATPRPSPRYRDRHPETIFIAAGSLPAWSAMQREPPPAHPRLAAIAERWRALPENARVALALLGGVGAFLAIASIAWAVAASV